MSVREEIKGKRYDRLVVLGEFEIRARWQRYVKCKCDCGVIKWVRAAHLVEKRIVSCGCLRKEKSRSRQTTHGLSKTRTYNSWLEMRGRCTNENDAAWDNYGGRGITVCNEWSTFEAFFRDMGHCPSSEYSIDRLDNNKGYEPANCAWRTRTQQSRNRRNNRVIALNGVARCVSEWAEVIGISVGTIRSRLNNGWSEHDAITVPVGASRKQWGS